MPFHRCIQKKETPHLSGSPSSPMMKLLITRRFFCTELSGFWLLFFCIYLNKLNSTLSFTNIQCELTDTEIKLQLSKYILIFAPYQMHLGDILGYTEHLSPLLSLLMDELSSLHRTLLTLLPPRSPCDFTSHRVLWTWLGLMSWPC